MTLSLNDNNGNNNRGAYVEFNAENQSELEATIRMMEKFFSAPFEYNNTLDAFVDVLYSPKTAMRRPDIEKDCENAFNASLKSVSDNKENTK